MAEQRKRAEAAAKPKKEPGLSAQMVYEIKTKIAGLRNVDPKPPNQ